MRSSRRKRFGFVVAAAAFVVPTAAEAQLDVALRHIRAGQFHAAKEELRAVTSTGCKALAHYLLAYANAHLDDAPETIRNASRSLACQPVLPDRYRAGSAELLSWAALRLAGHRTVLTFEFSLVGETPRDLAKVAAMRQLIDEAVRQVPGLRERVEARAHSAASLNNLMLCFGDTPSRQCQQDEVPELPLPEAEE